MRSLLAVLFFASFIRPLDCCGFNLSVDVTGNRFFVCLLGMCWHSSTLWYRKDESTGKLAGILLMISTSQISECV